MNAKTEETKKAEDQAGKPASTNANAPATANQGKVEDKTAEPAKNPAPGPQSTKPVVGGETAVKDPDAGGEAPKNLPNDNAQAEHRVAQDQAKLQAQAEANNVHQTTAATQTDSDISAREQAELDKVLGDQGDGAFDDEDDLPAGNDATPDDFNEAAKVVKKLLAGVPASTPDEHTVWGAGGVVLNLGHLRALAKYMR